MDRQRGTGSVSHAAINLFDSDLGNTLCAVLRARIKRRLETGMAVYGDNSFGKSSMELIQMIKEELEDAIGWGYILSYKDPAWSNSIKRLAKEIEQIYLSF